MFLIHGVSDTLLFPWVLKEKFHVLNQQHNIQRNISSIVILDPQDYRVCLQAINHLISCYLATHHNISCIVHKT